MDFDVGKFVFPKKFWAQIYEDFLLWQAQT